VSSRESRVTGQLTDGSRGSRVEKCDPLSSLVAIVSGTDRRRGTNGPAVRAGDDILVRRDAHILVKQVDVTSAEAPATRRGSKAATDRPTRIMLYEFMRRLLIVNRLPASCRGRCL